MGSGKRKKRRTHRPQEAIDSIQGLPKSFVVARNKVPHSMRDLVHDFRQVMMPLTTSRLKERAGAPMKDYLAVAGPLGITHIVAFSYPDSGATLRLCKTPHGPTLHFRIQEYSLCADVVKLQRHPHSPGLDLQTSPLSFSSNFVNDFRSTQTDTYVCGIYKNVAECTKELVLNNFGNDKHMQLASTMFQNMFPPIDVDKIALDAPRRVLLVHHDAEQDVLELRHYITRVAEGGLSKNIKKIIQKKQLPDLSQYRDISEYMAAEVSDSEGEDPSTTQVEMSKSGASTPKKELATVRLTEIGPRLKLQLTKIQEGFCGGEVVYHRFVEKSTEEVVSLRKIKEQQKQLKLQRKMAQQSNVAKKRGGDGKAKKNNESDGDDDASGASYSSADEGKKGKRGGGGKQSDSEDDAYWYKKEVGQEPDEDQFPQRKKQRTNDKFTPWFVQRREKSKPSSSSKPSSGARLPRKRAPPKPKK